MAPGSICAWSLSGMELRPVKAAREEDRTLWKMTFRGHNQFVSHGGQVGKKLEPLE